MMPYVENRNWLLRITEIVSCRSPKSEIICCRFPKPEIVCCRSPKTDIVCSPFRKIEIICCHTLKTEIVCCHTRKTEIMCCRFRKTQIVLPFSKNRGGGVTLFQGWVRMCRPGLWGIFVALARPLGPKNWK